MKSNPLFVDSTRFHGDLISTQFELRRVFIYDGESLFVVVTRDQGDSRRFPMKLVEEGVYGGRVHLNHQTLITYRFEIESNSKIEFSSRSYRARVQYAIVTDWEPSGESTPENEAAIQAPTFVDATTAATSEPAANPEPQGNRIQVASIRSMMDQFGL